MARAVDVAEVLLLAFVDVPEHPLQQHFGEAQHGVERGAQLVGHAGQELRLVPTGHRQLGTLLLELVVEPRVEQSERRLARERLQQLERLLGELTGPLATDDESPEDLVLSHHRYRHERTPAIVVQDLEVWVELDGGKVWHGDRPLLPGRAPDERLVEVDPDVAQLVDHPLIGSVDAPHPETALAVGVLHDRAAIGGGELDGVHGDGREHAVDVETGADRLADLAESLQLLDLPGELRATLLQLLHELDTVDRHGGLAGERRHDRHLTVVERVDVVAPDAECSDDLVVEHHRCAHRRPEAGHPLEVVPTEVRVLQYVGDLHRGPVESDATHERAAVQRDGVLGDVGGVVVREPHGLDEPVDPALEHVEMGGLTDRHRRRALSTMVVSTVSGSPADRPMAERTSLAASNWSFRAAKFRWSCSCSSALTWCLDVARSSMACLPAAHSRRRLCRVSPRSSTPAIAPWMHVPAVNGGSKISDSTRRFVCWFGRSCGVDRAASTAPFDSNDELIDPCS